MANKRLKKWADKSLPFILIQVIRSLRCKQQVPPTPCIVAVWHEDIMAAARYFAHIDAVTIISPSQDAQNYSIPLAKAMGIKEVRFSSGGGISGSKNPQETIKGLFRLMAYDKSIILLAVDGSRGPRRKAKAGIFLVAKRKGFPIYACRFSYRGLRINNTWDKTKIALPFAKISAHFSEPIFVNKNLKVKDAIVLYEGKMAELSDD